MKKLFLFAAIAILGLASCTDEQIEGNKNNPSKKIQFKTMVGKNSNLKATELTTDGLKTNGFKVTALNTASLTFGGNPYTSYFDNLLVSWNGTKWTNSGNYYWPEDDKLSFFAYGGDNVTLSATTPAFPSFNYTIGSTAAAQKDLVTAVSLNKTNSSDTLGLVFNHILTQINFSIKGAVPVLIYIVKKIEIIGAKNSGTYTYSPTTGGWTAQAGVFNYTYFDGSTTPTTIPTNTVTFVSFGNGTGTAAAPITGTEALMLMPQDNTGVQIKVTYDIQNPGGSFVKKDKVSTYTFVTPGTWNLGTKIRYNITLPVASNRIELSGTVSNWNDETGTGINL
ncbi:MAG: fimbrillin family protein [Bacteroidales bacterium]|nr:fimbrillin family protein [Bacteroidales bacterium]